MNWAELSDSMPNTSTLYAAFHQDIEEEAGLHDLNFVHKARNKFLASCHVLGALQEKTRRYRKGTHHGDEIWLRADIAVINPEGIGITPPFRNFLCLTGEWVPALRIQTPKLDENDW
jgi:hypothetical protein